MTFGEKVRSLRQKKELSQTALASEIGVSMRTVQNYEANCGFPKSTEIAFKLSKALDVSYEYLMGNEGDFVIEAQVKYGYKGRKDAQELINDFGGLFAGGELSENDKDAVFKALTDIYWETKENNKKYIPKKYK
jgi:transcriptional regulator with XRE-family HTH domain